MKIKMALDCTKYGFFVLLISACANIPSKNQSTTIPFQLVDNRIMVPVMINGKGPYSFIFDTGGARAHTLSLSLAKDLGLKLESAKNQSGAGGKSQQAWTTVVNTYSISDLNVKDQRFDVVDLVSIQRAFKFQRLDGIIGYDVLRRSMVCVNFEKQVLILRNGKADCFGSNGVTVPFRLDHNTPVIDGEINGIKTELVIDTGDRSAFSLFQKFAANSELESLFVAEKEIVTGMGVGGPIPGRLKSLNSVHLGPIKITNVLSRLPSTKAGYFAYSPLGGSIGNEVLRRFNLILDYSRNQITFYKNNNFEDPYQFVPPALDNN